MIYCSIISIYLLLLLFVGLGFALFPYTHLQKAESEIAVSIIIVARNEEEKIEKCLDSIARQNYSRKLMEIILIDDASIDATVNKTLAFLEKSEIKYQLIQNKTAIGKKESLKKAINASANELMMTRDADTFTTSNEWLNTIVNFHLSSKKEFIICPVAIENNQTFLGTVQEIETAILSLFTISSSFFKIPFLCSGANLAFTKKLFYQTKAYAKHIHIPSGDDIFFLEDVKAIDINYIGFLKSKDAIVYTYPETNINGLIHQKARWSAKVFKSASLLNWLSALIIAITNFTWLGALFNMVFYPQNASISLFFVMLKLLIDFLLVFLAASFMKVRAKVPLVLLAGCFYPVYASVIAILALLIKPKWKN